MLCIFPNHTTKTHTESELWMQSTLRTSARTTMRHTVNSSVLICRASTTLAQKPSEVLDYGNVYTPVIDLLTKRYEEQLFTVITTNLTPQKIREHYGDRIADRFNEMVKKIVFSNGTYRTDKLATPG